MLVNMNFRCFTRKRCFAKDVLPEKDLLEKAAIMKRFEYLPLGKEFKAQTKKQYQKLDHTYEFDRIAKIKTNN